MEDYGKHCLPAQAHCTEEKYHIPTDGSEFGTNQRENHGKERKKKDVHALKKEEGEGKRGENIKDCIFNFILKRRTLSDGFSF